MAEIKYKRKSSLSPKKSKPGVIQLDPKRIKESEDRRWGKELRDFMSALSETEFELAKKLVYIICRRPDRSAKPCEVIQFEKDV